MKLLIAHALLLVFCGIPATAILAFAWTLERRQLRGKVLTRKWIEPEPVEPQPDTPHDALQDIKVQHTFWSEECTRLQTAWMWAFRSGDTLALHQLEGQIRVAEHRFHIEDLRLELHNETAASPQEDR